MRILIDTREQLPYQFENSEVGTIPVGDYSICGLENHVAVERKELNDLNVSYLRGDPWITLV